MRIAHIAATRNSESSAAWRILSAQREAGVDARALVHLNSKNVSETDVFPDRGLFRNYRSTARINSALRKVTYLNTENLPWSYTFFSDTNIEKIQEINPDIVNIHWLPSVLDIKLIHTINKPIVLTLHDVWPITGGCHCNLDCERWKIGCTSCPQTFPWTLFPLSAHHNWNTKLASFNKIENLSIVAPSNWIAEMAESSPLFENRLISVIPNCADTRIFTPINKIAAKRTIEVSRKKVILLYVVSGNINQYHKGIDLLKSVLRELAIERENFQLLIVGNHGSNNKDLEGVETKYLGEIDSQEEMSVIYNASDLMISTSRQDNLPNTLVEATLCGTPLLAFNIGGIADIIKDDFTGKLIGREDISAMAKYISGKTYLNADVINYRSNSSMRFTFDYCSERYINHYKKILKMSI